MIQEAINEVNKNVEELIKQEEEDLFEQIDALDKKDVIINYRNRIYSKLNSENLSHSQKVNLESQMKYLDLFKKGSEFFVKNSLNEAGQTGFKTMTSMASGSNMRNVIYNTGKFFGKKFKPWEATRMAGNIGKYAKYAKVGGVIAGGLSVAFDAYAVYNEEQKIKKIQGAKASLYSQVRANASKITKELSKEFLDYIQDSYGEKLKDMDSQKTEIINAEKKNTQFSTLIESLDAEYVDFIELTS